MRKICTLLAIGLLLLCLAPCAPVWALDDGMSYFWGFPGDTWTISNPTDSDIKLEDRQFSGYSYVITDSEGLVQERVPNAQWKEPVIPAGGKAIVMNWQKQYAMQLDSRLEVVKDETPALIQADLRFFDCVEFTNKTDHSANVVVYSASTTLSYVVFDQGGTVTEFVSQINGYGATQDVTVSVPAGGKINVICCTAGWLGARQDSVNYPTGSCLARSENFTLNEDAEPAILFFRLFENMTRSFENISGAACDVFGYGDYVLYNAAGKVDSIGAMSHNTLSVPAGWSVAFSAEGGYRIDGSSYTGNDGYYGVPAYAFTEVSLSALEYYTFPKGHIIRMDNKSGATAPVDAKSSGSASVTIYNSAGAVVDTKSGRQPFEVPAKGYAVIECTAFTVSYKAVIGQFTVTHTPAGATEGKYHLELARGESRILTNNTANDIDIAFQGQLDYKVYKTDGSNNCGFGNTKGSLRIPAGARLHATSAKGITSIDADAALVVTDSPDPVAVHQTVRKGESYLYDSPSGVGQLQFVGMRQWENYEKDGISHTFVGTPDAMQIVAWKENNLRKVDGDFFGVITLNKGEACEFIAKKEYGEFPQIHSSKPCLMIKYPADAEDEVVVDVSDGSVSFSGEGRSAVLTAVQDGTKIQYPAQFYNAIELKEDPLVYATVKEGEVRDFGKTGNIMRLALFGLNPNKRDYNEYSGFVGYDWGSSYFLYFSGTGTPYGMVKATDSDVLAVGVKDMVRCDPIVVRAYSRKFYDKSGTAFDYYEPKGLSAIELECESTVSTPETMDVFIAAYDSDERFISCERRQIKRSDLGPAFKIPYSCGTNVRYIMMMFVDDQRKPLNLKLDLTW